MVNIDKINRIIKKKSSKSYRIIKCWVGLISKIFRLKDRQGPSFYLFLETPIKKKKGGPKPVC